MFHKVKISICNDKQTGFFQDLGETESLNGNEINFSTTFVIDYFFEKEQILNFQIEIDGIKKILNYKASLGMIMGRKGSRIEQELVDPVTNETMFILDIDMKSSSSHNAVIRINLNATFHSNRNFVYYIISNMKDGKHWRHVYKSNEISGRDLQFDAADIPLDLLDDGNHDKPVLISFYDEDNERIGIIESTLNKIKGSQHCIIYAGEENRASVGSAQITFVEENVYKFVDYIKEGLQINLIIGVDFTASNLEPLNTQSLHYIQGAEPNVYERAIRSCGSIVAYYDYDQFFPVFGFGGIPHGSTTVQHCFPLNNNPSDPNVMTVEGVINVYKNALYNVTLYGPTFFAPLIEEVLRIITQSRTAEPTYYILMILTDGMITDVQETIDVIVKGSTLPLSIIIIGVGTADFTNMNRLDGDDELLRDSKGVRTSRDIVQFVPFNKFEGNAVRLAEEVLQEVPRQVEEYYRTNKVFKFQ